MLNIPHSKRTPFALQKGSFYTAKGLLLRSKTSPFGMQNESFFLATIFLTYLMPCSVSLQLRYGNL